ncbi:MAG: VacJ family lipoprotein [Pseudomonadota bacterium]
MKLRFATRLGSVSRAVAAAALLALAGCASSPTVDESGLRINDPYERVNRGTHAFNKGADRVVLRPVAQVYDAVTPGLVQFLIRNALNHLELPRDFANHLLQGDAERAGATFLRFGVNTLVGAGGLLDPATAFELPKDDADFGMTLTKWGLGEGIYYEIPLLGPSTVRHTAGRVVDIAFAPTTYLGNPVFGAVVQGVRITEARASNFDAIDSVLYESADSYASSRSIYLQSRRRFVGDSTPENEPAPDIFAE